MYLRNVLGSRKGLAAVLVGGAAALAVGSVAVAGVTPSSVNRVADVNTSFNVTKVVTTPAAGWGWIGLRGRVTVKPNVQFCDPGLSVGFNRPQITVHRGTPARFVETVNVSRFARRGATLHCSVRFLIDNRLLDRSYIENIAVAVTLRDTVPPVVSVQSRVVQATGPSGAVVRYAVRALDNVDGLLPAVCTVPQGATLSLGTHIVVCQARDRAGNVGRGVGTIRVVDTVAPRVGCLRGINPTLTSALGYFTLSAVDLVDPHPVLYVLDSASVARFGPFPVGTHIRVLHGPVPGIVHGISPVDWVITVRGTALLQAVDASHNASRPVACV